MAITSVRCVNYQCCSKYAVKLLREYSTLYVKNRNKLILKESRSQAKRHISTSTVGRSKCIKSISSTEIKQDSWFDEFINVRLGDSLNFYEKWDIPTVIISDGAYGVLGFEGDTPDHLGLANWYRPHIAAWSAKATPSTTLWFWNSEIGWATVHPVLEKYGWRYVNANIWDKGKGHIAGNVNTNRIRRFPVVTEICVQYVYEARINGLSLKEWLLTEWKRTGIPLKKANEACGVADAAVRKYFDQGHVWYFPPPVMFLRLQEFANKFGKVEGRPYFSIDGKWPGTMEQWSAMRAKFKCPYGFTNVWSRAPIHGAERCRTNEKKEKLFI